MVINMLFSNKDNPFKRVMQTGSERLSTDDLTVSWASFLTAGCTSPTETLGQQGVNLVPRLNLNPKLTGQRWLWQPLSSPAAESGRWWPGQLSVLPERAASLAQKPASTKRQICIILQLQWVWGNSSTGTVLLKAQRSLVVSLRESFDPCSGFQDMLAPLHGQFLWKKEKTHHRQNDLTTALDPWLSYHSSSKHSIHKNVFATSRTNTTFRKKFQPLPNNVWRNSHSSPSLSPPVWPPLPVSCPPSS